MDKIFEKIYSEKDISTNISIFVGSVAALIVYLTTMDLTLVVISFIAFFSLSKVASKFISNISIKKAKKSSLLNHYSQLEKETIGAYMKKGTCFITMSDHKKGIISGDGLDSLVYRGIIEFHDNSMGDGPSGFKLDEEVYKTFLGQ